MDETSKKPCSVEACDRPAFCRGWCRAHYMRWHTTGDLQADVPVRPRWTGIPVCVVDGCDARPIGRGLCRMHYSRWWKHGDPDTLGDIKGRNNPNWLEDHEATYQAAHQRLGKAKGRASEHRCVDCGGRARDWSYIGGAPDERVGDNGHGHQSRFSLDFDFYAPRCQPCHRSFDKRKE